MRQVRFRAIVPVVLAAVSIATFGGCDRGRQSSVAAPSAMPLAVPLRLDNCAVIGASVSAGAEVTLPGVPPKMLTGDANLADALAAATGGPSPASFADLMFFMRPDEAAEKQLASAMALKPRIVFALDYLFWHAYGAPLSDAQRRKLLERGLDRLARIDGTVVIADLPDMSHAVGKMLFEQQVPSPALLDELNARIAAWAAPRKNIVLIPIRGVVAAAMKRQPVSLGGMKLDGEKARGLLVESGLHTSADGLIALALECLDRLQGHALLDAGSTWEHDASTIKSRLTATKLAATRRDNPDSAGSAVPPTTGGK